MNFIVYTTATGEITKSVQCPEEAIALQCREGEAWIQGDQVEDAGFYVLDGQLCERPAFDLAVQGHVISGMPAGATLTIEGQDYEADGEPIEFEPSIPGSYTISIRLFPYKDTDIQVTA
jgi:hypothetical protein